MYELNGILLKIVKTWVFEGEHPMDFRAGRKCYELKSADERYGLNCFEEELEHLTMVT